MQTRTETIINNQAKQPTAQVQPVGSYGMQSLVSEVQDGLNNMKQNFAQFLQKAGKATDCPQSNCVSVTAILVVAVVQLAVLLGYFIYRYVFITF